MAENIRNKHILPLTDLNSINVDWLTKVLSQYYDSHCSVTSFEVDSQCSKEGYLSEIGYISVSLNFENGGKKKENLVVKCLPKEAGVRKFIISGKLAEREINFYSFSQTDVFKVIASKSGCSLCVPEVVYCDFRDLCLTIVMKNLKDLNYKTILIKDGNTLQHTMSIFSAVAVIHAAGLYHFEKYGNHAIKRYLETSMYDQYLETNLEKLSEIFKGGALSHIFKEMILYSKVLRDYHLKHPLFETVIHGDLWAGQCMFSENEEEVCILDWQFATLGNPIVDLMGMFFMSSHPNILEYHVNEVLEHYWKELKFNLDKSNIPFSISYADFLKCVHKHWMSGFLFIAVSLHDFQGADNISDERLRGLMNFLYKNKSFHNFIQECKFSNH